METNQIPVDKNSFNGIYLMPIEENPAPKVPKKIFITDHHSGSEYVSLKQLYPELTENDPQ